ncbi:phosphatase 2C 44 [Olea europaea subsp. europaea]|uniref:Phosphatase 2C 44 n=1 Tax=Olea europaea subsp. europaea TaxID=158383 RepID=A0A8S0RN07_OLEEU|nr:phosphatase 2C 44 [Olea europaea subsp. europaea]
MGLKDLHLKLKATRLRRFLIGNGGNKERKSDNAEIRPPWMMNVSHGYHVVEDRSWTWGGTPSHNVTKFDSVVIQREQIEQCELWFFGVFEEGISDGVLDNMKTNFFNKKLKESNLWKRSKEAMRRAHLSARAKMRERQKPEAGAAGAEAEKPGSASAIVINGEKLVTANMGEYRAIVCRDGKAYQISRKHWSQKLIPGALRMPQVCVSSGGTRNSKSSELVVGSEGIDSETEFLILASTGVWEVTSLIKCWKCGISLNFTL